MKYENKIISYEEMVKKVEEMACEMESTDPRESKKNDKAVKAIMKTADAEKNGYSPTYEIVESDLKYRSAFCKPYIKDAETIQYVALNEERTLFLAVDEDGLLKQLPLNFFMEVVNPSLGMSRVDVIVGTAVFLKIKKVNAFIQEVYDYEVTDLTDDDIAVINRLLDTQNQIRLFHDYKKQLK